MKGKKTGGRQKGTPNKEKPLRASLRSHSDKYFSPNSENPGGISDFEIDLLQMDAASRAATHIKLLKYHTPEMKSVDVEMTADIQAATLGDKLARLVEDNLL